MSESHQRKKTKQTAIVRFQLNNFNIINNIIEFINYLFI